MRHFVILKVFALSWALFALTGCSVSLDKNETDEKTYLIKGYLNGFEAMSSVSLAGISNEEAINLQIWTKDQLLSGNMLIRDATLNAFPFETGAKGPESPIFIKVPVSGLMYTMPLGSPRHETVENLGSFDLRWACLGGRILQNTTRWEALSKMNTPEFVSILARAVNDLVLPRTDRVNYLSSFKKLSILPDGTWQTSANDYPESEFHPHRLPEQWEVNFFQSLKDSSLVVPDPGGVPLGELDFARDNILKKVSLNYLAAQFIVYEGTDEGLVQYKPAAQFAHVDTSLRLEFKEPLNSRIKETLLDLYLGIKKLGSENEILRPLKELAPQFTNNDTLEISLPRDYSLLEHFTIHKVLENDRHLTAIFSLK